MVHIVVKLSVFYNNYPVQVEFSNSINNFDFDQALSIGGNV